MCEEKLTLQGVLQEIEVLLVKLLADKANDDRKISDEVLDTEPMSTFRLETSSTQVKESVLETTEDVEEKQVSATMPAPPLVVPVLPSSEELVRRSLRSNGSEFFVPKQNSQSTLMDPMTPIGVGRQVSFMPEAWDSLEESTEGNFHLHHGWRHKGDRPSCSYSRRRPSQLNFAAVLPSGVSDVSVVQSQRLKYLPRLRIMWACLTGLMIIFDNLTIPLMVFTDYRLWAGELIFWILNLPVRLFLLFYFGHGQTWGKCFAALEVPLLTVMIYEWLDESASPLWQGIYMLRILQFPRLYGVTGFARWVRRWFHGSSREVRAVVNILMALLMCIFSCTF